MSESTHMNTLIISLLLMPAIIFSQSQYRFFINNINMPMDNKGIMADVQLLDGQGGLYNNIEFLYSGGFWLSGYNGDSLWANAQATASQMENYIPGKVGSDPNDPLNKVYVVDKDDPPFGTSWQEWIDAVQLGADFYDGDNDGVYNPIDLNVNNIWDPNEDRPDIIGDRIAWCVYNDVNTSTNNTKPFGNHTQGIEIQQSVFGYRTESSTQLNDVIFIRYKIINSGLQNAVLDSVYFTAWADADLGIESADDLVGCDTMINSGYVYNSQLDPYYNQDPTYFINLLQGAPNYIPGITFIDVNSNGYYDNGIDTPLDSAYNYLGPLRGIELIPGAVNNQMTSFMLNTRFDYNFTMEPDSVKEVRYFMNGYDRKGFIIDPCSYFGGLVLGGINCNTINPKYMFSGSPEIMSGWVGSYPDDIRLCVNSGPFKLIENEPITIIVAYTLGLGSSPTNSVTVGKLQSQFVQEFYESNFDDNLVSVEDEISNTPTEFFLYQNYPNPFNPSTTISWQSPVSGHQTLKIYDVLGNEVATLVNEFRNSGSYEVDFNASSLSSGIYFYKLQAGDFVQTRKMLMLK